MSKKITPHQYVESGRHLPTPLQDFHDCKNFFSWLERVAVSHDREDGKKGWLMKELPKWDIAHIYTIDYFLWFMAQFGYTLQRSRANVEFRDLQSVLAASRKQQAENLRELLDKPKQV